MIVFLLLLLLIWWVFWKKTYAVRIESAGDRIADLQQALKIELETSLHTVKEITENTPFLVGGGNFLYSKSVVRLIRKYGGKARIQWNWVWSKPKYGHIS